ncbi:heavy-metal-associated domain-containing protein [Enterococcus saccharolyticus]|uniref:Metal-binding protein n=1 Tax=Candidatus Enterococcus willemsii TaxID=1857215 RepID=A0ABQ6Z1E0_9ENTE|nr:MULTISPECIES: heavy metal-associated domain-containing protein [Enterococcus]KAF1305029.1 metal-binding protein [Enterococcus sp. CU12B]MCD5003668.1 heavy-metal-associated domain-containing protein [Enterococcus saccharolyticus]
MKKMILQLETLTCPSCMQKIERALKQTPGVDSASIKVLFNASKVKGKFNSEETSLQQLQQTIETLGYDVLSAKVLD